MIDQNEDCSISTDGLDLKIFTAADLDEDIPNRACWYQERMSEPQRHSSQFLVVQISSFLFLSAIF